MLDIQEQFRRYNGIFTLNKIWGGGGPTPFFPQDTPKFGFGDGQKWGKKYMEREGNKLSIFKIEKIPIFSHDAPKF